MDRNLNHSNTKAINAKIKISGSKSESNRLLILQKLYPNLQIYNLSDSDDTKHLQKAFKNHDNLIDIGHAGTAMRFLTAYYATQEGTSIKLTGSDRMQKRPIKILVEALQQVGANIQYLNNDGYPPIQINGEKITKNKINIQANVSSQYISALLLIAPSLKNGLILNLEGNITSTPYINMTLSLLNKIGVHTEFKENTIIVRPLVDDDTTTIRLNVEPDWSSASYFYSLVALVPNSSIELENFSKNSLQGDSKLAVIYKDLGVQTTFTEKGIILNSKSPNSNINSQSLSYNLVNTPDLAQTIAVTCFGLGIACHLTGLHTLKIKETDRLQALKNELEKLGASVTITEDSLFLKPRNTINKDIHIRTYQDHRMAMAFAPLSALTSIVIEDAEVVSKSYPNFWKDWESLFK